MTLETWFRQAHVSKSLLILTLINDGLWLLPYNHQVFSVRNITLFLRQWRLDYRSLLYRHECFTGKYTPRKIHKNYIQDPSGLFSIISHVSLSMT